MNPIRGNDDAATLERQLECDDDGALRDLYLDRLHLALDEIAIAVEAEPEHGAALAELGHAVRMSESVLLEVWNSYHGTRGRAARLPSMT